MADTNMPPKKKQKSTKSATTSSSHNWTSSFACPMLMFLMILSLEMVKE
jgi:hypothetical protein